MFWSNGLPEGPFDHVEWVVPDNCADIILHVAPDDEVLQASVVGTMTRPMAMRSRPTTFVGARFHPGWLPATLGIPGHELRDAVVPLSDVSQRLQRVLRGAKGRPHEVLAALVNDAMDVGAPPPPLVREAVQALAASRGLVRIERLCRELRVTRQHLARCFDATLGISPKFAGRVVRMQHVLRRAAGAVRGEWARVALESGYADQSHLVEDLRELTGRTPSALAS